MSSTLVHVGVRATNLPETLRFWRDALGLRVVG
jgi:catechol 2,3-dioxygenase-like lactoylglutathione lyase family enzyme